LGAAHALTKFSPEELIMLNRASETSPFWIASQQKLGFDVDFDGNGDPMPIWVSGHALEKLEPEGLPCGHPQEALPELWQPVVDRNRHRLTLIARRLYREKRRQMDGVIVNTAFDV